MKILKYTETKKNSLQGFFNLKIERWGDFIINDMRYFVKDNQRWVSFPQKMIEKDGEKKYFPYNTFENQTVGKAFSDKVLNVLDEYLKKNNPEPIKLTNEPMEIPF